MSGTEALLCITIAALLFIVVWRDYQLDARIATLERQLADALENQNDINASIEKMDGLQFKFNGMVMERVTALEEGECMRPMTRTWSKDSIKVGGSW